MDLSAMDLQEQIAVHCLMHLSRKKNSSSPAHNSLIHLWDEDMTKGPLNLSHFPSHNRKQQPDSTGDYSGSDRLSPSSSSDCSLVLNQEPADHTGDQRAGDQAVDLTRSGFRTRPAMRRRGAAAASAGSLLPDHRRRAAALKTQKVNDDPHRQCASPHQQREAHMHVVLVQNDAAASSGSASKAGSLSDHSPFMIGRIMSDLNQYRQQHPHLTPDSGIGHSARLTAGPGIHNQRQAHSHSHVPDAAGNHVSGADAVMMSSSSSATCQHQQHEITSPAMIRKKRKSVLKTTASASSSKKRSNQKKLSSAKPNEEGADQADDTPAAAGDVVDSSPGVNHSGKGSHLTTKSACERQCKHACAFPGCDKVYGKSDPHHQPLPPLFFLLLYVTHTHKHATGGLMLSFSSSLSSSYLFAGKSSHLKSHFRSHTGLYYVSFFPFSLFESFFMALLRISAPALGAFVP